jgi:hypothetical protein
MPLPELASCTWTRRRLPSYGLAPVLTASLLLTALVACSPDSSGPRFDERACASFVIPTAMGLAWENLNHRISRYAIQLSPAPGEACLAERVETVFIGGDYSTGETLTDIPRLRWSGTRIAATSPEQMGAARLRLDFLIDAAAGGEATLTETLDRDALHLLHYPHVIALVEGLALRTDVAQAAGYPDDYDPAHGYTSRGIGAELRVVEFDEAEILLEAILRFAHGTSDRKNMNGAMASALTEGSLDVLLIGLAEAPVEGSVDYGLEVEVPPLMRDVEVPHAPALERQLVLALPASGAGGGQSGLSGISGLVGWTGFRFELDPVETEGAGYYIRELSLGLNPTISAVGGSAPGPLLVDVDGYASNASKFVAYYGMRSRFLGHVAWLPLLVTNEALLEASGSMGLSESFETGSASFELPR